MKIVLSLIVLLFVTESNGVGLSSNVLLKQGEIELIEEDIEGYALTIPKSKRFGFFESPERIDSTLDTLLKMKHVVNYAKTNNILDNKEIEDYVSQYLVLNNDRIIKEGISDFEFLNLKSYLNLQESYKFIQRQFQESVKDNDVIELAQEQYEFSKNKYLNPRETRDLKYINIRYKEADYDSKKELAKTIKEKLRNLDFDQIKQEYEKNKDIEFVDEVNDYYYTDNYKEFSDFVFKETNTGVLNEIFDAKNRFIIVDVVKIYPKGVKSFDDVKQPIIDRLKKDLFNRKFADLLLSLTTDEIRINEELIISLRTKYKNL